MGRPKKEDAAAKKAKAEILAAPPKPERDWGPIVDARTEDPKKRQAMMLELARLDELERAYRPLSLQGIAAAGRLMLDFGKQRARLLGLTTAELGDDGDIDPSEVDVVDWTPSVPAPRKSAEDADDDADDE